MAIPGSGPIKISEIATEFGDTTPNSMSEYYRGGSLVPDAPANASIPESGAIEMQDFYGATNRIAVPLTISANTQNYNVYTQANASPLYTAGIADVTLTINPGVVVGSSSTGSYALNVPNAFNAGDTVTIVNNGTVIGRGGNGGNGGTQPSNGGGGGGGGNAVYVNRALILTNNGTLAGGGGGGGGGGTGSTTSGGSPKSPSVTTYYGGGGGGGGAGNTAGSGGAGGSVPGPNGGSGAGGSTTGGGGGGAGPGPAGAGGSGGGQGANGSSGAGGNYRGAGGGGTRGSYLVGNPNVTYPATGTRLGQVS